jgi:kynurenine formamidase
MRDGIVTRGILIDLPGLNGQDYLEPSTAIPVEDLDRWEREAGIVIEPGDVVLVRTGRWALRAVTGPGEAGDSLAGLHPSTAAWFAERDISALGTDAAADALPSSIDSYPFPLHTLLLVSMGTPILDNLDLEELAVEAERQGRWTFLLVVAPMRVAGGFGGPVNPLAVF